jgi:thymidylate synthase
MSNYQKLIERVSKKGQRAKSRAGNVLYTFGETYSTDLRLGFPVVTEREIDFKQAFGELAAFIHGCTTQEQFQNFGCKYWSDYGDDLGPIYGAQWRNFQGVDQLNELLFNLSADPTSRRHILSTWNPADLDKMALPPCHLLAQFNVADGVLEQIVYMRSVDVILGLPYDIIVYAGLQSLIANQLGLVAGKLKFFFGNTHIYTNHIDAANQILVQPARPRPALHINNNDVLLFEPDDFFLTGYEHGPKLKIPLNL